MRIIKNPWNELFFYLVQSAENSIKIASPFVKENIVTELLSHKKKKTGISLITSFRLMYFFSKASDLNALRLIIASGGHVKNFQRLHSKIYIFDDREVIISSGNLTSGGIINNYEYGILTNDPNATQQVVDDYASLINNDMTGTVTLTEIKNAAAILEKAPKTQPVIFPEILLHDGSDVLNVYTGGSKSIETTLTGWKRSVFNCISTIPNVIFSLKELYAFEEVLKIKYPGNNEIQPKIRQQLQFLRDIGLIEFLGGGIYKKLWN